MIKTILFDADGVLINGKHFGVELEKKYSIPKEKINPFFANEFSRALTGEVDLKDVVMPYLSDWGWQGTVDELLQFWFSVEHSVDEKLVSYIQNLRKRNIQCFVATNQEKYRAKYMLEKMGFSKSFDGIFASAHLGAKKPDLEFFSKILDQIGETDKESILFWDDSPLNVEAAREFGIQAEHYTTFDIFSERMKKYSLYE